MEAYSIEEAMNFFLNNSSGSVTCIKNEDKKVCNCYPDAVEFFNNGEQQ